MGTDTGDLLMWNATTGAWEVLAKPAGWAILITNAAGMPQWLLAPSNPTGSYLGADDAGVIEWYAT
jgi:hypothetical protein